MHLNHALIAAALAALALLLRQALASLSRRHFMRRTGALPAPPADEPSGFLGYAFMRSMKAVVKAGDFTLLVRRKFDEVGKATYGSRLGTVTVDPENVRHIFYAIDEFVVGPRREAWAPAFEKGIFIVDGKEWEHSRALLRPSFKRSQISQLGNIEYHVQSCIVSAIPADGSPVNLQRLFYDLTMRTALGTVFGDYDASDADSQAAFDRDFTFISEMISLRMRLGWAFRVAFPAQNRAFVRASREVHGHLDQLIAKVVLEKKAAAAAAAESGREKEEKKSQRYSLLDELLQVTNDQAQIRWEIMSLLGAGRETTASLLSHLFHILVRRPDVWAKLLAEMEPLGGQAPDFETLQRMRYLRAVINETLRLWPSVFVNTKFASRDTTLPRGGGPDGLSPCFIAKGDKVVVAINAMHRLPTVWGPDADVFRPERWLDDAARPPMTYLPFGAGPRICLGQQTSLTTAGYALVRLMQACPDLENRDPRPYRESVRVVVDVRGGVLVGRRRT